MKTDFLQNIAITSLVRGQYQPRQEFDPTTLRELADSIAKQGIIEPIIVRPISSELYEIVAGERRWRAAQLAGQSTVPCLIREYDDAQAAEVALLENIQREDLNPIEEARALVRLTDEFAYTHEQLAMALGKSRAKITNQLRLLNLDPRVQRLIVEGRLSEGHGKVFAGLAFEQQFALAQQCCENDWSVRRAEQALKQHRHPPKTTPQSKNPDVVRLERIAADRFNSEVKLESNEQQNSGWLKIKYYDLDTLSGILQKMGVDIE